MSNAGTRLATVREGSRKLAVRDSVFFSPASFICFAELQEEHEGVIAVLAEVSVETRGTFLDLAFLRKQRQRSGGASSRSWYVTIDHWLTGTVAATEAAQAFGGEEVRRGLERALTSSLTGTCNAVPFMQRHYVSANEYAQFQPSFLNLYCACMSCASSQPLFSEIAFCLHHRATASAQPTHPNASELFACTQCPPFAAPVSGCTPAG